MKDVAEFRKKFTEDVIESMGKGNPIWIKPWDDTHIASHQFPKKLATGEKYRGINPLILLDAQETKGFKSNLWAGFKAIKDMGGHVLKGETGTTIVFYKEWETQAKDRGGNIIMDADGNTSKVTIPIMQLHNVFNVQQTSLWEREKEKYQELVNKPLELRYQDVDLFIKRYLEKENISLRDSNKAAYTPANDYIKMPAKTAFLDDGSYYATFLHEMTHSTGHASRLNREISNPFGSANYAKEELVAEMGSAFLCMEHGIEGKLQHKEYLLDWMKALKDDPKLIFWAAGQAQKASDFINERGLEKTLDKNLGKEITPLVIKAETGLTELEKVPGQLKSSIDNAFKGLEGSVLSFKGQMKDIEVGLKELDVMDKMAIRAGNTEALAVIPGATPIYEAVCAAIKVEQLELFYAKPLER